MCIKGFCLSYDCHFDIDRDVLTIHCRSSSDNNIDLLSWTIISYVVVSDWFIKFIKFIISLG